MGLAVSGGGKSDGRPRAKTKAAETVARLDEAAPTSGAAGPTPVPAAPVLPVAQPTAVALLAPPAGADYARGLVHAANVDAVDASDAGLEAGLQVLNFLKTRDLASCRDALATYARIEPVERFGGEYPALRWLCTWSLADETKKEEMRGASMDATRFVRFLDDHGERSIMAWVAGRYGRTDEMKQLWSEAVASVSKEGTLLGAVPAQDASQGDRPNGGATATNGGARRGMDYFRFVDEVMRLGNPNRDGWEHPDQVLARVKPKPGERIADVGAAAGYFTWRFADAVGPEGKVYAVEASERHRVLLADTITAESRKNVEILPLKPDGADLPEAGLDVVFMCDTWSSLYVRASRQERLAVMASVKKALKPGGRLVVLGAAPEDELALGVPAYVGDAVSASLVAPQIEGFGFRATDRTALSPQRYLLVFERLPGA